MIDVEIVHLFGVTYGAFDSDGREEVKGSYGYVLYCMAYVNLKGEKVYNITSDPFKGVVDAS